MALSQLPEVMALSQLPEVMALSQLPEVMALGHLHVHLRIRLHLPCLFHACCYGRTLFARPHCHSHLDGVRARLHHLHPPARLQFHITHHIFHNCVHLQLRLHDLHPPARVQFHITLHVFHNCVHLQLLVNFLLCYEQNYLKAPPI